MTRKSCSYILNDARDHQLAAISRRRNTGDFKFNGECVAGADSINAAEAATLGWCMSWYGYLQLEPIFRPQLHPAFVLASWFAHLPNRPLLISRQRWFAHVEMLLRYDLVASWKTWCRIAKFMRTHEMYFLHPALAQTAWFAAKHLNPAYCKEIGSILM